MNHSTTASRVQELLIYDASEGVFRWRVSRGPVRAGTVAGRTNTSGHIQIRIDGTQYLAHRLVWLIVTGDWPTGQIDHFDRDKKNNRFANLRDVSQEVNQQNQIDASRRSTTGLRGAYTAAKGRFRAAIKVNGKIKHIGTFATALEAHHAHLAAKAGLHPQANLE